MLEKYIRGYRQVNKSASGVVTADAKSLSWRNDILLCALVAGDFSSFMALSMT